MSISIGAIHLCILVILMTNNFISTKLEHMLSRLLFKCCGSLILSVKKKGKKERKKKKD